METIVQTDSDKEVFSIIDQAAKQYEEYLKIAATASLVDPNRSAMPSPPSWNHPMTVVFSRVR